MILIGLCGAAGAGKGSVASHLADAYGFEEMAFADPLYAAVSAITGKPVKWLKDRDNKETVIPWIGKSPRQLLQLLGTEFGREMIHSEIWVKRAMWSVRESAATGVVITDVRFDNEALAVREAGGVVFEVVRPGAACLAGEAAGHSSEAGISRGHILATIRNEGTLDDLWGAVDAAMASLHADIM